MAGVAGTETGSSAIWCWHGINGHTAAGAGNRAGCPMGAGGPDTLLPLGPRGIWDGLVDNVTLPLAQWWMGSGAIYPLSLLSSPGAGPTPLSPVSALERQLQARNSSKVSQGALGGRIVLCQAVPRSEACRAGGLPPPSFPQAPSRRSFPDDLTGYTFPNPLVDCFIIGGQLKRRRVPVAPLRTPSLPESQNKGRNWVWARPAWIPI